MPMTRIHVMFACHCSCTIRTLTFCVNTCSRPISLTLHCPSVVDRWLFCVLRRFGGLKRLHRIHFPPFGLGDPREDDALLAAGALGFCAHRPIEDRECLIGFEHLFKWALARRADTTHLHEQSLEVHIDHLEVELVADAIDVWWELEQILCLAGRADELLSPMPINTNRDFQLVRAVATGALHHQRLASTYPISSPAPDDPRPPLQKRADIDVAGDVAAVDRTRGGCEPLIVWDATLITAASAWSFSDKAASGSSDWMCPAM